MRIAIYGLFSLVSLIAQAEIITPFTSDGHSVFPDGTVEQKKLWLSCCTAHNYAYWQGCTYEERLVAISNCSSVLLTLGSHK